MASDETFSMMAIVSAAVFPFVDSYSFLIFFTHDLISSISSVELVRTIEPFVLGSSTFLVCVCVCS